MATSPTSCAGDGFSRPASDGHYQPPGIVADAEAIADRVVSSRFIAPSGLVPGDDEGDCTVASVRGGVGAGLDCFSFSDLEVLCAKCRDWFVISNFFVFLFVKCNSAAEN